MPTLNGFLHFFFIIVRHSSILTVSMVTHVVILGYGEMGKALHHVLKPQPNLTVTCWDKNSDILPHQSPLQSILPSCDVLIACVPTWTTRSVLQEIHPYLQEKTIIVSVSKGFEKETCQRVDTLFPQHLPKHNPFVFLGGPMISEELLSGLPATGVAASMNKAARNTVAMLFRHTPLVVRQTDDIAGTVLSAALKNIYALGLGMCDGLHMGSNIHGSLVSQAVEEMMMIVEQQGGRRETALGPAGLGDLVATAQSTNSTNYMTGTLLAQGLPPHRGSEAMNTLPCVANIPNLSLPEFPFLQAIYRAVVQKNDPHKEMLQVLLFLEHHQSHLADRGLSA
jgi:glycerol-3-phosphate dehydrogenase (NAD(P)+)